jgi:lactonase
LITLLGKNEFVPAGLAIHKDGRIFRACVGDLKTGGGVIALQRDGLQPVRQLLESKL